MIRHSLLAGAGLSCLLLFANLGNAQTYPAKPLRIIVGQTAGGISDLIARMVAQRFTEAFKQPAVVENRAGAAGSIGTEMAVKAAPDGYTLLLSSAGPIVINPGLYSKLSYDPQRDLAPIAFIASSPLVLVTHPSVPAKSVKALIALAKAHPYKLSYGSGGNGSPPHLTAALFSTTAGVTLTHVPFKGSAPSVLALVGGQVDLSFSTVAVTLPQMRAGRIHALAVTSAQRARILPDLPTMAEAGLPGFESQQWFGLFGPAALPRDIIGKLNSEVTRLIENPDVRTRLANDGAEPGKLTLDQFTALIRSDAARWTKVIKVSGATAE
jgi:tripartite-type tricarboxylate transporter receptor subunit TctC